MSTIAAQPAADDALQLIELGDGPTLGYLHGPLGNPSAHSFLRDLASDHHVIAPSLPGFNTSPPARVKTFYDWVFQTSAAVDAARLAGAPLVAASVGAMLALEVAAIRPEAFSQLVVISPLGLWDPAHPVHDIWSERTKHQPSFLADDPDRLQDFFGDPEGLDVDELMEAELQRYRTRAAAASLTWQIPDHGLVHRLHRVQCPVHLVWGADDRIVAPAYAERFRSLLPRCTGPDVVEGAGHLAEWDAPDRVAAIVRDALG